jgi:DNA end-binding protein Ku
VSRTLWSGTLELDEIAIPVGIAATVSDKSEKLRRIHVGCGARVSMRGYCERHEQLLDPGEIVDAWEVSPGQYIEVSRDARDALEPVETRRMPIGAFVPAAAIAPALTRKRYQLIPSSSVGARAYFLFTAAIAELQVAGLVRFTAWRSEQLAAVHSRDGSLELHALHFGEDLVEPEDLGPLVDAAGVIDDRLLDLARDLVDRHTRPLQPGDLDSLERPRVRQLLEQLLAGQEIVRVEPAVQEDQGPTGPSELEGALRRSIKHAPRRRRRQPAATR